MSRPRRGVSRRVLYVIAGAAALAAPPFLLRAEPENWPAIEAAVANMTQAERDRLERNTQEYLALPEAEREKYRRLHAVLQEDIQDGHERLASTMRDYSAWLSTNQAYDRQELTGITDPAQRLAKMQQVADKRDETASGSKFRWSRFWLRDGIPELPPEQLNALITAIENRLHMTDEEQNRLLDAAGSEKSGSFRHFAVLSILRDHRQTLLQFLERNDADQLLEEAGIKPPASFEKATAEDRRVIVVRMIIGNVLREYESNINRKPPSSADLEKLVANWPQDAAEQQKLLEMLEQEPADFRRDLEQAYARDAIKLDSRDVMGLGFDLPRPGWFGGRGRGGPDDRERGEGRGGFRPGDRFGPPGRDGRPEPPPRRDGDRRPDDRRAGDGPPPEGRPPRDFPRRDGGERPPPP